MHIFKTTDNKGRRTRFERRRFSYALHFPERRSDVNRIKGDERRDMSFTNTAQNKHRKKSG